MKFFHQLTNRIHHLLTSKMFWSIMYITLLGGILRFYNLNWDHGNFFHPDERNIANAVSKIQFFSQLNPEFFAYGGFTIYLTRAIGEIVRLVSHNDAWVLDWGHINVIARSIAAFASTLTIPIVYLLTSKLSSKKVGLLSALFTAFTVGLIQTAHFGITESLITALSLLLAYTSLCLYEKPHFKYYLLCAFLWGVSLASKTSAFSFILFPLTAHLLSYRHKKNSFLRHSSYFVVFGILSICIFLALSPYTVLTYNKFLESMSYESGVVSGRLPVVYTYQFINTPSYLFQYLNLFWQMGMLNLLTPFALIYLLYCMYYKKNKKLLIVGIFPIIYFLYVGSWHTKFIRYMIPIIPFFLIFISLFLAKIKSVSGIFFGRIVIFLFLVSSILWSLLFFSIYTTPQTRIVASSWIYTHIKPGSIVLGEHWDDGLPVPLGTYTPALYDISQLTIYDPDSNEKIEYYAEKLSQADYIVINSRRLYGTLMHLPEKYPVTSIYYRLLFDGSLGYTKVAEFTSYPSLGPIVINDDNSEETFQVYDHPKVIIFQNIKRFPPQTISNQISSSL